VKNQKFNSRSFKARFSSAWSSRFEIMSLAAHEFVHGAFGIGPHTIDSRATDRAMRAKARGDLVMGREVFIHPLRPRSPEGFRQSKRRSLN